MLSILPLCILGISTLSNLRAIGQGAIESSTLQLENRAKEALELRAIELADRVNQFLRSCEADLLTLRMLPQNAEVYRQFSLNHRRTVWTREGTKNGQEEVHKQIPLYKEVAFIGPDGKEQVRIVEDRIMDFSVLRDVSKPENTSFKSEHFFQETAKLKTGQVYVSHVTGWYASREERLRGTPKDAVQSMGYEGVIRFATPCFGQNGEFEGIIVLSLEHRHLMELTLHILPTSERFAVSATYSSGNYAFMFDDEGWMISHPKPWNIRGILRDGREIDPAAPSYTRKRLLAGEVPFNLDYVTFIHPNYRFIAREVRAGRSGVTDTFNVGGTQRVVAYAPIIYNQIPYNKYGVFGGITIGNETAKFMEPAFLTSAQIDHMVAHTKENTLIILGSAALMAVMLGIGLARKFTKPILYLARKASEIAAGEPVGEATPPAGVDVEFLPMKIASNDGPDEVMIRTGDEVEFLAVNFARMAKEIRRHQASLERSLAELAQSKKSVEQYSHQLEKQLRVLKTVHYLSQYLGTVYERELVLQTVLRTCVKGLGYDRAILYLYDPSTRCLICHQTFGFSPEHKVTTRWPSYNIDQHDCIPTKVFRSGETIFVQNIQTDDRATSIDLRIAADGETDCFVFTAVKGRDRAIGVLGADTKTSRREIKEIDIESLEILANDAARAIERSELHGELVAERNFIKSIVTHMASGIITLDESGRLTWFNPYSENVFKIKPEDALGKHYRDVFAALPSWIEVIDGYLNCQSTEQTSTEHHTVFQDGKEKVLAVHSSRIYQDKQHHSIFALFVSDITQRKRMEEHIRRSDRLVSLGVLAAGIAHEMRNPLTGISLLLDDLHDHLKDRPQERELIQKSLEEMDRLENLISGLLDFSVPSRRVNLEVRPLGDVVRNTVFLVRKLCENQRVSLSVQADESLPVINLDAEKLQQALLNLLLNAIQAMPDGGKLDVGLQKVSGSDSLLSEAAVRIAVTDTGKGVLSEDLPYVFDPFFTRNPSGCGLGLAIVHSIVQEHKGRISVSSQLDKGTTFWVDLPVGNAGS